MVYGTRILAKQRFHGLMRPMKLKSSVRASAKTSERSPCVSEMANVMSCWKSNNFDDTHCQSEIQAFIRCCENVKEGTVKKKISETQHRWDADIVNSQLRKFAWPQ